MASTRAREGTRRAVEAAQAVAAARGVHMTDPRVLTDGSNVVVHLRPAPVVARVATATAAVRVHDALAGYAGDLPPVLERLEECEAGLGPLEAQGLVSRPDAAMLRRALRRAADGIAGRGGVRALHGDAHPHNALRTAGGPLWTDLEDACAGPVEWDLACLVTDPRRLGVPAGWDDPAGAPRRAPLSRPVWPAGGRARLKGSGCYHTGRVPAHGRAPPAEAA